MAFFSDEKTLTVGWITNSRTILSRPGGEPPPFAHRTSLLGHGNGLCVYRLPGRYYVFNLDTCFWSDQFERGLTRSTPFSNSQYQSDLRRCNDN
jgi:hypothetical protein